MSFRSALPLRLHAAISIGALPPDKLRLHSFRNLDHRDSLTIGLFRSPVEIDSPEKLAGWLVVIGLWDLTHMFCFTVFAASGNLFWELTQKKTLQKPVEIPRAVTNSLPSGSQGTGNPSQTSRD